MKGGSWSCAAEAMCEQSGSLRRKRGRPRKVKPDPTPTPPKPLPTLRPTPLPYGHLPVAPPAPAFAPRHPTPLAATTATAAVEREIKRWAGGDFMDDEHEQEQVEEPEKQVAGLDRVRDRGKELRPPTVANSGLVPSVLQLLVNELQDMKHSVDAMKKDVSRLSAKQRTYTNMQHDLTQRLDSLPVVLPSVSARSVPRPTDSARAARLEFLRQFPFLERYNLATRDVPFILDDLRKPFAIFRFSATHWERGMPHPIIVYASGSFCELTQYELHELQGCPPMHLGVPDRTHHRQLIHNIAHRTYADISDTLQMHPLLRTKNGNIIKTTLRHQAFFDDDGDISWVMVCIDGAEPARGDDVPLSSLAHGDCTGDMSHEDMERAKKILFPTLSPTSP